MLRIRLGFSASAWGNRDPDALMPLIQGIAEVIANPRQRAVPGFVYDPAPSRHYTKKRPPRFRERREDER